MLNKVILIGRLCADPSLKFTSQGTAVATFTMAVNRRFNKEETDFMNCVVWKQQAEFVANYGTKGRLVCVEGRIQVRNYENNEGRKIYITEIVADSVQFLDSKKSSDKPADKSASKSSEDMWDDLGRTVDLNDLDIPL